LGVLEQLRKSEDFICAQDGKREMETEDDTKLMFYDCDFTTFFVHTLDLLSSKLEQPKPEKKVVNQVRGGAEEYIKPNYPHLTFYLALTLYAHITK